MGKRRDFRPQLGELDERCLLSGLPTTGAGGYTPAQITSAYGLNAITITSSSSTPVKGDGTGETIALIEVAHDPNIQSDLATFDSQFGLPSLPSLTVINQAGGQTDRGWSLEESLDVEWAHALAPGAGILVVEAPGAGGALQEFQNLMAAVSTAGSTPGVVAVSMSWGFGEFPGETAYDANFTAPGITYIAASGDTPGAEYPAASPYVLSVGGTSLQLDGSGNPIETAWSDSGGGYSQFEAEPSYQRPVQTTGQRSVPDVAFDGDPNTGVLVYATSPNTGRGSWNLVGGTSLGTPAWAAVVAIADQGRALAGMASLSGATQALPTLYSLAATDFQTIAGSSTTTAPAGGFLGGGFGWWSQNANVWGGPSTGATANTTTGLGSPHGLALVNGLVASTTTMPMSTWSPPFTMAPSPAAAPTSTPTSTPTPTKPHHHKPVAHPTKTHATHPHLKRVVRQKSATEHKKPAPHHTRSSSDGIGTSG
jgi:hypothetical protein